MGRQVDKLPESIEWLGRTKIVLKMAKKWLTWRTTWVPHPNQLVSLTIGYFQGTWRSRKLTSATGIKAGPLALCICHLCVISCVYYPHCGNSYSFPICVGHLSVNPVTIHFKMTGVSYFKIRGTKLISCVMRRQLKFKMLTQVSRPRSKEGFW